MKKLVSTFLVAAVLGVMIPALSVTANAQTRNYRTSTRSSQVYKRPNIYKRHRNIFNMAIGTGAGAILGGLIGGKRGAGYGALAGAGGSALYTYKINPKKRYNRYYR